MAAAKNPEFFSRLTVEVPAEHAVLLKCMLSAVPDARKLGVVSVAFAGVIDSLPSLVNQIEDERGEHMIDVVQRPAIRRFAQHLATHIDMKSSQNIAGRFIRSVWSYQPPQARAFQIPEQQAQRAQWELFSRFAVLDRSSGQVEGLRADQISLLHDALEQNKLHISGITNRALPFINILGNAALVELDRRRNG